MVALGCHAIRSPKNLILCIRYIFSKNLKLQDLSILPKNLTNVRQITCPNASCYQTQNTQIYMRKQENWYPKDSYSKHATCRPGNPLYIGQHMVNSPMQGQIRVCFLITNHQQHISAQLLLILLIRAGIKFPPGPWIFYICKNTLYSLARRIPVLSPINGEIMGDTQSSQGSFTTLGYQLSNKHSHSCPQ